MKISRRQIREILNESLLLNEVTINMKNSPAFTSKEDSSTGKATYVHQLHQLDPIVRKIARIVKRELKKGKGKSDHGAKVVNLLRKSFIKDASGRKIKIGQKHEKGSFFHNIFINYLSFANEYYKNGASSYEKAITAVGMPPDLDDTSASSRNLKGAALVKKKDGPGVEVKTTGQSKDSDIITIDFKNAIVNGKKIDSPTPIRLTEIFRDILSGQKTLSVGSGRKWIKGSKKPEDQMEWMQVKVLQGLLLSMKGDPAKGLFTDTDGDFGSKTKTAVMNMQKMLNLEVDGVVGQQTASALNPKVTGSKIPITGAGKVPDEVAKKIGLSESFTAEKKKEFLKSLISRL